MLDDEVLIRHLLSDWCTERRLRDLSTRINTFLCSMSNIDVFVSEVTIFCRCRHQIWLYVDVICSVFRVEEDSKDYYHQSVSRLLSVFLVHTMYKCMDTLYCRSQWQ